jgi:ERAP1-like C-terminal domain
MKTWEDLNGYPIIHVEKTESKYVLTQSNKYPDYDDIFKIPISYKTKSGKTSLVWMKTKQMEIDNESAEDWIVLDFNETGLYEVKYGTRLMFALVEELKQNPLTLSESKKKKFLKQINFDSDDRASILALLGLLKHENSSSVWAEAYRSIDFMTSELSGSSVYLQYQNFVVSLIKPHLDRLGFVEIENESSNDKELRETLIGIASIVNYEEYLQFELERFKKFLLIGEGDYDSCEGLKLADAMMHSKAVARMLNQTPDVRERDLAASLALTCSLNRQVLTNLLQLTIDKSNNLDNSERSWFFRIVFIEYFGREVAFDFIKEHFNDVIKYDW